MPRKQTIYPVILAGGSGTRFWPLSRKRRPKQFLALAGERPLLVETVERITPLASFREVLVVAGTLHEAAIRRMLPRLPRANLLLEPVPRNTAPAIGWAAMRLLAQDPDAVLAVLPSDHHIRNVPRFRKLLHAAAALARQGALVTLGITPTGPETGFGYLRMGEASNRWAAEARPVDAFVEKPNRETAEGYLASGRYLWNAGIFIFRASTVIDEIRRQLPKLATVLDGIGAAGTRREASAVRRWFPKASSISIDYGIMEHAAAPVVVLPADVGWSDLGSFDALTQVRKTDRDGNLTEGQALLVDCKDCIVLAGERPVAVVGERGQVVVDTGDAVLVVPRDRVQDVRQVVAELERRGLKRLL